MSAHHSTNDVWRKSSRSATGNCLEARVSSTEVTVRNSRDADGPALIFTTEAWRAFIAGVRVGEFDADDDAESAPTYLTGAA